MIDVRHLIPCRAFDWGRRADNSEDHSVQIPYDIVLSRESIVSVQPTELVWKTEYGREKSVRYVEITCSQGQAYVTVLVDPGLFDDAFCIGVNGMIFRRRRA